MTGPRSTPWNERGVALMLVLWLVVVLSAVAIGVVSLAHGQVRLVETGRSRTVARYAAESGVVAVKARLEELFGSTGTGLELARVFQRFETEVEQWGVRSLGQARFQVAVLDLGSRIDLNRSSPPVVQALLQQFVRESDAVALVDALEDWKDRDRNPRPNGAEADYYASIGSPFTPPNAPLLRLDELTRIKGFDDPLANKLAPYVTVRGGGRINLNTAPHPVLAALPLLGAAGADAVVRARESGQVLESLGSVSDMLVQRGAGAGGAQLRGFTTLPERILVISRGWQDGLPLTHEIQAVLVLASDRTGRPTQLRTLYWTERDL